MAQLDEPKPFDRGVTGSIPSGVISFGAFWDFLVFVSFDPFVLLCLYLFILGVLIDFSCFEIVIFLLLYIFFFPKVSL